jgi:hypothetical protein
MPAVASDRAPAGGSPRERLDELADRASEIVAAHLAACEQAAEAIEAIDDPALWPPSPALAPFCGCDTCLVRETLAAIWPHIERALEAG